MSRKKPSKPLRAVFVADLHCGSHWGLTDPSETNKYSPGKQIQERLYREWQDAASGPWAKPDALVVAGDAVEGQSRKDGGTHCWTTDIDEQVMVAAEMLRKWKAKQIYILGGSGYHVLVRDSGLSAEEMLARNVGAVEYPGQDHIPQERRKRSGIHWFLTFGATTVHVAHHVSISRVFHYKSTPIAREMMQAKLNDPMRRELERMYREMPSTKEHRERLDNEVRAFSTKVVIRAHGHYFWACDAGGTLGMTLPAWKCPDPFIARRDPLGFGHLGFVGMEFDGDSYRYEKNLVRIEDIERPPHTLVGGV